MAPDFGGGARLSVGTIAIVGFGLLVGYMSCLFGAEAGPKTLVAFAVWSAVTILAGFMITWFFKYVLILAAILIAALWYSGSPSFGSAAADLRGLRGDLCTLITIEIEGLPVKEWIC